MTDIVFAPLGDVDWITPIAKAGKAGRDGDGDGILNEGKKRSAGGDAATVGSVGAAAAAGGVAGKVVGDKLVSRIGTTMTRTAPNTFKPVLGIKGAQKIRVGGGLAGAVAGTAIAASLLNPRLKQIKDDLSVAVGDFRAANIRKSDAPLFAPIGGDDFIQKAGKAGRDGDGDGILNEGKKKTIGSAKDETKPSALSMIGSGAGLGAGAGLLSRTFRASPGDGSVKSILRVLSRSGLKGAKIGGVAGALVGTAAVADQINERLTKAYADDVAEILASDVEDKASEIAKSGEMLAEIVSSLNPQVEFEKADGAVDFATSVARVEFSKACAEIDQITSAMVEILTKSVTKDPSTLESAIKKFDAEMEEFLSALDEEGEEAPQPVVKAAAPVFMPLA